MKSTKPRTGGSKAAARHLRKPIASTRPVTRRSAGRIPTKQLQAFFDNCPAPMFAKDAQGRYLHVNRRFAEAFGIEPAKIIGRRDDEIFDSAQAAHFQVNDRIVLQSGNPLQVDETARFKDGLHTCIVFKFPLQDDTGKTYGIGGIATDITGRQFEEDRFRATFE
jgi:PAS domain S-box-containing protein